MTGDIIDSYTVHMHRRALAAGTVDKRVRALRMLEADVGPLLEVGPEGIERFLDGRRGRAGALDPRTRVCWLSHLRCFYQWAIAHERCWGWRFDPRGGRAGRWAGLGR